MPGRGAVLRKYFTNFIVCFAVWILLAGIAVPELILGALVAGILAFLLKNQLDLEISWKTPFALVVFIVVYIPVFIFELIKANIDVLLRVLNPKLPVNPGFVRVRTGLESPLGRLILANSITLTPGTISIDADSESIYIHWIDVKGKEHGEYEERISGRFERILKGMSL